LAFESFSNNINGNRLLFPQPVSPQMMVTRFLAIVSSISERWASMGSWAGTFARALRRPGGVVGVVGVGAAWRPRSFRQSA